MKTFKKINEVWFWQNMLTPHMGELAVEFAKLGYNVTFVSNQILSKERIKLGWQAPKLLNVKFKLVKNKEQITRLAEKVSIGSIHLVQGIRGNGIIKYAQKVFRKRNIKQWIMLETINSDGLQGVFRSILYRALFFYWKKNIEGVLAIGKKTPYWVATRGIARNRIYSFAYFLKKNNNQLKVFSSGNRVFRFIFVGQLIKRKRVDYLIKQLAALKELNFELWVIGTGNEKNYLHKLAEELLGDKVKWFNTMPMNLIPKLIKKVDCLVLPSQHDGWGAVVSEALMAGTPVICSDSCGSSEVVEASNCGFVFPSNNKNAFINSLLIQFKGGLWSLSCRKKLVKWANCLSAKSGANYLAQILNYKKKNNLILPPWKLKTKNL
jgi:glycosyltransferase involved in cell wall biosynthesis